ncbi:hypothetical protein [Saccharothrix sp.]|uniref:hypothetical protein n=1 Tax=Saccharothrix sp. TaxID=1873460 RepID=UPI0028111F7B|nr:hypothetical protein [Saccharothrix sp.]
MRADANSRARSGDDLPGELLVGIAIRVLPGEWRARYAEEFRAELADLRGWQRLGHSARLLTTSWSLRRSLPVWRPPTRQRWQRVVASAASILAIVFAGAVIVARYAEPGEALWPVTETVYADQARSTAAALLVQIDLEMAWAAIREERWTEAYHHLDRAEMFLRSVLWKDGYGVLTNRHEALVRHLRLWSVS